MDTHKQRADSFSNITDSGKCGLSGTADYSAFMTAPRREDGSTVNLWSQNDDSCSNVRNAGIGCWPALSWCFAAYLAAK
jgi:hypothetical protein